MGQSLPRIRRLALPDAFPHKYGVQNDLLEIYGLMPDQIAATVSNALNKEEMVA
jgi:transketolase